MAHKMTAEDKKFQAESDVRTLVQIERIKGDPARLKMAMTELSAQKKALIAAAAEAGGEAE